MRHAPITKKRPDGWPEKADYVHLSMDDARSLVEEDIKINGMQGLLTDCQLRSGRFPRGIDSMNCTDLILAIRTGIERNALRRIDDPQWFDKIRIREKQLALFGDLDQPIAVMVGITPLIIKPAATSY
jgi:hypothetical protein